MQIIYYEKMKKPVFLNVEYDKLKDLVGGTMDIEEMICDTCVVWFKDEPIPKDRSKYHRNVYITKYVDGKIVSIPTPIYSNFFLCGYKDNELSDMPQKHQNEIMAMFGF